MNLDRVLKPLLSNPAASGIADRASQADQRRGDIDGPVAQIERDGAHLAAASLRR